MRTSVIAKVMGSEAAHPGFGGSLADLRRQARSVGKGKRGCRAVAEDPCRWSATPHRVLCSLSKGHVGDHLNAAVTCDRIKHAAHR